MLHFVWHSPSTSKGRVYVTNKNKGSLELSLPPAHSACEEGEKGGPGRRVIPQLTSSPDRMSQLPRVLNKTELEEGVSELMLGFQRTNDRSVKVLKTVDRSFKRSTTGGKKKIQ